eukprot:GFKZ01010031.1.p3 GENE.GFKZ01010031.1~~GFKZ01010031.1.p3  ORF type:complete len:112 (-),score=7.02 GFKZ01010031.1:187-522(-)
MLGCVGGKLVNPFPQCVDDGFRRCESADDELEGSHIVTQGYVVTRSFHQQPADEALPDMAYTLAMGWSLVEQEALGRPSRVLREAKQGASCHKRATIVGDIARCAVVDKDR